ncbi:MAG: putative lipid II flippase FtsW [Nitrospinota bacterium]
MKSPPFDRALLGCALALTAFGLVMVNSAGALLALDRYGDPYLFAKRQGLAAAAGLGTMFLAARMDYRRLERLSLPLLALTLLLLAAVFLPGLGRSAGGARRWLQLGPAVMQPAEFAKLALVVFASAALVRRGERLREFTSGYLPVAVPVGAALLLIALQPDLGSALLMSAALGGLFFAAGARLRHLVGTLLLASPALFFALFTVPYRRRRILAFLDPWSDPSDSGYQILQSLLALGRGGVVGLGLGEGRQKLFYLPEPHTDFIYAVVGEELGMVGAIAVLAALCVLCWRGFRLALRSPDPFGAHLAAGLTLMVGLQALLHIGVVVGFLPTKGLPLPFVSQGGSSLWFALAAVGLLLSVSARSGPEFRPVGPPNVGPPNEGRAAS